MKQHFMVLSKGDQEFSEFLKDFVNKVQNFSVSVKYKDSLFSGEPKREIINMSFNYQSKGSDTNRFYSLEDVTHFYIPLKSAHEIIHQKSLGKNIIEMDPIEDIAKLYIILDDDSGILIDADNAMIAY